MNGQNNEEKIKQDQRFDSNVDRVIIKKSLG